MDPRDASSIHNQRQPPPQFAFGRHFPNNNVFMMAPNSGPNLVQNPTFGFNSLTAPHPFDSGLVSVTHHQQQHQPPPQQQLQQQQRQQSPQQQQQQQQQQQNGSPVQGVSAASPVATIGYEQTKKKRGRPRKYSPASDVITLGLASNTPAVSKAASAAAGGGQNGAGEVNAEEGFSEKKQRGRPRGSGKKQLDALGGKGSVSAAGGPGFATHMLVVTAGENIVTKLVELSQGPRTVCVLSANGMVHNVTLRQVTGGTLYHEGQYEIVSLSGSSCHVNTDGSQNNTLSLTVTLAGPDGRLVGGGVTRDLTAASSIQMVACSFVVDGKQSNTRIPINSPLPTPVPHMLSFGGSAPPNESAQHDAPSDSAAGGDDDDSHGHPHNQNYGFYNYGQPWTGGTPGWA